MDYQKEYSGHCLTCDKYDLSTSWSEIHSEKGFWCKKHGWTDPYDKCGSYSRSCNGNGFLEDCMKAFDKKRRYYIVTICTKIVGLPKNNEYVQNFQLIEQEFLLNTLDGKKLLFEYDYYGKKIANAICEQFLSNPKGTKLQVENELMPKINKINNYYKKGKVKEAIMLYIVFVRRLMNKYGIEMDNNLSLDVNVYNLEPSIVEKNCKKFSRVLTK